MIRISEIKLPLTALPAGEYDADAHPEAALRTQIAQMLAIDENALTSLHVHKRSFDARKVELMAVYIVDATLADAALEAELLAKNEKNPHVNATPDMAWKPVGQAPADLQDRPVVIGFGPCGIFAALVLAQMGFKPIVLERGREVRERTKDTWGLWRKRVLTPESNVQFGEGGAGTFSDGKLYSQIKDPRHLGRKVMEEFVQAGAPAEILYTAHPHIGTFKLVKVVETLREQIIALGGEVRFGHVDLHGVNKYARRSCWSHGREGWMKAVQAVIAMACGQGAISDVPSTKSAAFCAMDAAVKTKRLSWRRASSQWAM